MRRIQSNALTIDDKLNWARSEYRKRVEECKSCKWYGDRKNFEKVWDNRRKAMGIGKDECAKLLEKAAHAGN